MLSYYHNVCQGSRPLSVSRKELMAELEIYEVDYVLQLRDKVVQKGMLVALMQCQTLTNIRQRTSFERTSPRTPVRERFVLVPPNVLRQVGTRTWSY